MRTAVLAVVLLVLACAAATATNNGNNGNNRGTKLGKNRADYVVVGAGAAGCALTLELLKAGFSVLVLEAGQNYDDLEEVWNPLMHQLQFDARHTKYDWPLITEYDFRVNKEWLVRMGRMFGGSSGHFTMEYVLPSNASLADWQAAAGGHPKWSVAEMIETFRRNERFLFEETNGTLPGRGVSGPIDVRRPVRGPETGFGSLANLLADWTAAVSGLHVLGDFNSFQGLRYGAFPRYDLFQTPARRRESASTAFLGPDVANPDGTGKGAYKNKLRVVFGATALQVLFDRNKRATGVRASVYGRETVFEAREEVILAGSLNSAKLLQDSGVGDASRLASLGVPVVFNNTHVGSHLHNHPSVIRLFFYNAAAYGGVPPEGDPEALMAGGAFFPEVLEDGTFGPADPAKPRAFQTVWSGVATVPGLLVLFTALEQPESEGWLRTQSRDPLTNPLIDQQQFTVGDDLEQMARFQYHFVQNTLVPHLQAQMGGYFFEIDASGAFVAPWTDLEQAKAWVLKNQIDASHYCGTNRMSPSAATGVVDWAGRVHGVQGLRVADSSVFPRVPDANTAALSMLVGTTIGRFIADGN